MPIQLGTLKNIIKVISILQITLLLTCIITSSTLQFHLDKIIKIPDVNNISKITSLKDNKIAIQSASSTFSIISYYQGENFQKKIYQFTSTYDNSYIKPTQNGVIINDGSSILKKNINKFFFNYSQSGMSGEMIVTPTFVLLPQTNFQQLPAFLKLSLDTLTVTTFAYAQKIEDWQQSAPSYFQDLKNGFIAFAKGYHILIINDQTLVIDQIISPLPNMNQDNGYISEMTSFFDQATNQSVLIFRYESQHTNPLFETWVKNGALPFVFKGSFYTGNNTLNTMVATSLTTSVSIENYNNIQRIYYWTDFNSVLANSYDSKEVLQWKSLSAVSADQNFFITFNKNNAFQIYKISDQYDVTYQYNISIEGNFTYDKKCILTSDNKYLFTSIKNTVTGQSFIDRIDIGLYPTKSYNKLNVITNQTLIDFLVFSPVNDLFASLVLRDSTFYYIVLRKQSDLSIVDQFQLPNIIKSNVYSIKLIGSQDWGLDYVVAVQKLDKAIDQQTAQLTLYNIAGRQVPVATGIGSFFSLMVISQHIVSTMPGTNQMKFLYYKNFSITDYISTETTITDLIFEKNYMLLRAKQQYISVFKYQNLVNYIKQSGLLFIDHTWDYYSYLQVMLPKRGALLSIALKQYQKIPTKSVYNINSPSLTYGRQIRNDTIKTKDQAIYFLWKANDGSSCNSVFYVQYNKTDPAGHKYEPQLVRDYECGLALQKYPILISDPIYLSKVFISKDQKYLIIGIKFPHNNFFIAQVRQIANLSNIIVQESCENIDYEYQDSTFNIDMISSKQIITHTGAVSIFEIEPQQASSTFGLSGIDIFDASDNNLTVIAGISKFNLSASIIIAFSEVNQLLFDKRVPSSVTNISISPLGTLLAAATAIGEIYVWKIDTQTQIYYRKQSGILKINLMGQNKLLIQYNITYETVDFTNALTLLRNPPISISTSYEVHVNAAGDLIAIVTDNTITIYDSNGALDATFVVPIGVNEVVVSVHFSPANNLVIATDLGNVYVLAPTPCPESTYSENLKCIDCNFPCKSCSGSATSCTQYLASFYVLVIGGSLLLFIGIIGIVIFIKRKNKKGQIHRSTLTKQVSQEVNSQNQLNKPLVS